MNFCFTKEDRKWNEDRCYSSEEFAFLIDGATALSQQKFSTMNTDAEWYANWWFEFLKVALNDKTKEIPTILSEGINIIIEEFKKLAKGETIEEFPSCTLSVVRKISNNILEVYIIGDSPVLLQTCTGRTIKLSDTLNNINDDINLSIFEYYSKRDGITMFEARKKYSDIFFQSRLNYKNKLWGYNVLSDNKEAIYKGIYKKVDCNIFKKAILMSDGYYQIIEPFKLYSLNDVSNKLTTKKDAEEIYNKLYLAQEADSNLQMFLRTKIRDDASVCVFDTTLL